MAADLKKTTAIPVGGVTQPGVRELMLLREATWRFGYLHELQVLQMRVWPGIFLGGDTRVTELRYIHGDRTMELDLGSIQTKGLNLKEGAVRLDKAVKFLLGCDVTVKVMVSGEAVYVGGPQDEKWLSLDQNVARSVAKRNRSKRTKSGKRDKKR